jgi:hypothetical protein
VPAVDSRIQRELASLIERLQKQATQSRKLDKYVEGDCPIPKAIEDARVTKAYRLLMPMSDAPWGSLIVDSVMDRLEPTGIRNNGGEDSDDETIENVLWGVWQDNHMDAEVKLAMDTALTSGRFFALCWRGPDDEIPKISIEGPEQMVIKYREGSRYDRESALRYWEDDADDDLAYATVYTPAATYKFVEARERDRGTDTFQAGGKHWNAREVAKPDGEMEEWPLTNPWGIVPACEGRVNGRLKAGAWPYARGEFEHCTGLIDRIHLLTFLGLVVAFWMGFPLRGVIGEKILRDDDNNPIAPFDVNADKIAQLEDPQAKTFEFKAADRDNLSIYHELDQLSSVTKTPRHYFPLKQAMANLAADAIRASEGPLHAKVRGKHKPSLGEGIEEMLRICGLQMDEPVVLSPRAAIEWADHESRSLAERADAASKLKDVLPWVAVAEKALGATQEELGRWESQMAGSAFGKLLEAAQTPAPAPTPEPEPATA